MDMDKKKEKKANTFLVRKQSKGLGQRKET